MKKNKGFTLLELLVVISIIGILMAIGTVSFTTAQRKSRDSRRRGDMKAIQKALEQCYAVDGSYLDELPDGGSVMSCTGQTVMEVVPVDPKNSDPYEYDDDSYSYDEDNDKYCLCALLEVTDGGNASAAGAGGSCTFGAGTYYCVSNQQ